MKVCLFLLLLLLVTIDGNSQNSPDSKEINVLFIGNSFTYYYDMPQILQEMLNETDPNIRVDQSTFPGMPLSGHFSDIISSRTNEAIRVRKKARGEKTETEKKLEEKVWDVVILQTGTVTVLIPENRELKINKAVKDIKSLVSNPNCKFILFYTWPFTSSYPQKYCYPAQSIDAALQEKEYCSPVLKSLEQEMRVINESYDLVADENGLIKSSNGTKFYEVRTKYPEINLYDDESHPNKNGAFLNACIFYQMLTQKKAAELIYIGEIDPKTAKFLKYIAGE